MVVLGSVAFLGLGAGFFLALDCGKVWTLTSFAGVMDYKLC